MKNYYKILNISLQSNLNEIQSSYNENIKKYNNLPFLTDKMKEEVKDYKIALFILSNTARRKKYNKLIKQDNNYYKDDKRIDPGLICQRLFSLN